jgi:microcystin-dependent protein
MANLQDIVNRSEVGAIKPWSKATAPAGYVLCDGAAISRTDYADLFAIISTTYGAGNGSTTFNVPNLQGKMPQGYDGSTYALAGTGGANTVTVSVTNNQAATSTSTQAVTVTGSIDNTSLTTAQLASHEHTFSVANMTGGPGPKRSIYNPTKVGTGYATSDRWNENEGIKAVGGNNSVVSAGSGTGHTHSHTLAGTLTGNVTTNLTGTVTAAGTNSFSPYVVVNYIIKH